MALASGNTATWADVTGIYQRVASEKSRWGNSTAITQGGQNSTIMTAHGQSLRTALINIISANTTFLSSFQSAMNGTAAITQGSPISVPTLNTMKTTLNGMRTVFGYVGTGTHFGTYGTGHNSNATSKGHTDSGDGSVWSFFNGGCFGHSGDQVFSFTVNKTTNNYCANCSSGYYSCNPYCTAGYCASYFNAAL